MEVLLRVNKPLALQVPGTKKISNPRLKIWGPAKIGGFNESPALRTFQYSPEKKKGRIPILPQAFRVDFLS